MNPGPVEEGGKVATSLIESLKSQPITLALVVFNLSFLTMLYFGQRDIRERQEHYQAKLIEQQTKFAEMLYNCTPIAPPPRFPN